VQTLKSTFPIVANSFSRMG